MIVVVVGCNCPSARHRGAVLRSAPSKKRAFGVGETIGFINARFAKAKRTFSHIEQLAFGVGETTGFRYVRFSPRLNVHFHTTQQPHRVQYDGLKLSMCRANFKMMIRSFQYDDQKFLSEAFSV